jgi:MFS family permease
VGCRGRPARAARRSHAARPGGEPWRRRTFLSGQAVSLLGDGLAALAIPLLVLDLSRSPLISALSAASVTVGYLMVGLPAGVLVDRLDPWRVLVLPGHQRGPGALPGRGPGRGGARRHGDVGAGR